MVQKCWRWCGFLPRSNALRVNVYRRCSRTSFPSSVECQQDLCLDRFVPKRQPNPSPGSRSVIFTGLCGICDTILTCITTDLVWIGLKIPWRLEEYHTWNSIDCLTAEIIATVAAVLADLGLSPIYSYPYQGEYEESLQGVWWYPIETPPPLFLSFDLERSMDITFWPSPSIPRSDSVTEAWHLSPGCCGKAPSQMAMYKDWARVLAYQGSNPNYTLLRIQPYRRLGVLVWDVWRMYSTGLMQWNNGEQTETPDGGLTGVQHVALQEWHSRWITLAGSTCWNEYRILLDNINKGICLGMLYYTYPSGYVQMRANKSAHPHFQCSNNVRPKSCFKSAPIKRKSTIIISGNQQTKTAKAGSVSFPSRQSGPL